MRILDEISSKSLSNITLLLTKSEAVQLMGYLEELISDQSFNEHYHLNNADFSKEITIALYDEDNSEGFSNRYKQLITKDI